MFAEIKKRKPESILDVGCGEGFTLLRLKREHIGDRLEGIEYLEEAIELGKKLDPTMVIKKGDIYKLPYKDNTFDLVLCTEVLEHLERPYDAVAELKRVSKKFILFSVPNEPLFTIQRFFRGKNMLKLGDHPEHIQHWSANSFRDFIAKQLRVGVLRTSLPWTLVIATKR